MYPQRNRNIFNYILQRPFENVNGSIDLKLQTYGIDRLNYDYLLDQHDDVVNCLDWNGDGKILLSGSYDLTMMLWDPFRRTLLKKITTEHSRRINDVKFLKQSKSKLLVCCGEDSGVFVYNVDHKEPILRCSCHLKAALSVAVSAHTPYLIWSASDDGTINQVDLREGHICCQNLNRRFINLRPHLGIVARCRSVAVNPLRGEKIAVGANDGFARIYDSRMIKMTGNWFRRIPDFCPQYFCPTPLSHGYYKYRENKFRAITRVAFNKIGTELLVNMGNDHIYLYDITSTQAKQRDIRLPNANQRREGTYTGCSCATKSLQLDPPHQHLSESFIEAAAHEHRREYKQAIDIYSRLIAKTPNCSIIYIRRAKAYLLRRWIGDVYSALRDCEEAISLDPYKAQGHLVRIQCLMLFQKFKKVEELLVEFIHRNPCWRMETDINDIRREIEILTFIKKTEQRKYTDNEWFSRKEHYWRYEAIDYAKRFVGRSNINSIMRDAHFLGANDEYIIANSDDGNFFVYDKETTCVHSLYNDDEYLFGENYRVSVVIPHPKLCLLASGGSGPIKIWTPKDLKEQLYTAADIDDVVNENQLSLKNFLFERTFQFD